LQIDTAESIWTEQTNQAFGFGPIIRT